MPRLIIDTNIWLDLVVFGDPRVQALRDGLESGHYRAIGTHAMRSELAVVLARPQFGLSDVQQRAALQQWEALTEKVDVAPPCNLSCRDPDDRKFLDLAVAHRVDWLLSKDRALLAARKFALRRFGLHIGTVEQMLAAEASHPATAPRCWHLLCQVIDNFGDAGVMWRLARQLRNEYGCTVRFFIDQPEIMQQLAPAWFQLPSPCAHLRAPTSASTPASGAEQGDPAITASATAAETAAANAPPCPDGSLTIHPLHDSPALIEGADVIVCGFQVRLPPAARAALKTRSIRPVPVAAQPASTQPASTQPAPPHRAPAHPAPAHPTPAHPTPAHPASKVDASIPGVRDGKGSALPPLLLQLEYLSAEDWVEAGHGLPSLQPDGLVEYFFNPGFTARTGGLLRERDLLAQRDAFLADPGNRLHWLARHGVQHAPDELLVSVLCYASAPLLPLLKAWLTDMPPSDGPSGTNGPCRRLHLLIPGASTQPWLQPLHALAAAHPAHVKITPLPFLPQPEFDRLLWSCDLNLVRGEDSWLRALWAGKPWLWQAYPQTETTHLDKLEAFLQRCARWLGHTPGDISAPPPVNTGSRHPGSVHNSPTGQSSPAQQTAFERWQQAMRVWNSAPDAPLTAILPWLHNLHQATTLAQRVSDIAAREAPDLAARLVAFARKHRI